MVTTPAHYLLVLAGDALEQLGAGKTVPERGFYLDPLDDDDLSAPYLVRADQLKERTCRVCAAGAFLLAHLLRGPGDAVLLGNNMMITKLKRDLPYAQLNLIEGCFEGFTCWGDVAGEYLKSYPDPKDRLRAILQNVIRNEGAFIPKQDVGGAE